MAKRRTSGIQRRERASEEAMNRRLDAPSSVALPDWRLLAIGGVLLIGVVLIALVIVLGGGPSASVGVQQPDDGQLHVTEGLNCRTPANAAAASECGADPYSSLPATSGPHWNGPANWGFYATPQIETQLIHNLEHGGVVIWYDPERLDAAAVDRLEQYVRTQNATGISGRYKFLASPWGGEQELPAPVVATAWRWTLELDDLDTAVIDEFAREHYGLAPEPNGGPAPPAT